MEDPEFRYVLDLAKKNYEAIGFIPEPRLREYADAGQLWTAQENGHLCGFLVFGAGWPRLRIYQSCIQYDVRRREHGLALVRRLIQKADAEGYDAISLWCANDLEANQFWRSCGFELCGVRSGGATRGRQHNLWVLRMPEPVQARLIVE